MNKRNVFRFEEHPEAKTFDPIEHANVEALAQQLQVTFCSDYLAFLQRFNGYDFDSLTVAEPWAEKHHVIDYLQYVFGVETGYQYNDLAIELKKSIIDPAYLRFVYPIGKGPGGNPIVQVHQGRSRGAVMLIDDDVQLSAAQFEAAYQRKLESFKADDILPWLRDERGSFCPVGASLTEFLDGLLIGREDNGVINVAIVNDGA
jgi:hypothetical protein